MPSSITSDSSLKPQITLEQEMELLQNGYRCVKATNILVGGEMWSRRDYVPSGVELLQSSAIPQTCCSLCIQPRSERMNRLIDFITLFDPEEHTRCSSPILWQTCLLMKRCLPQTCLGEDEASQTLKHPNSLTAYMAKPEHTQALEFLDQKDLGINFSQYSSVVEFFNSNSPIKLPNQAEFIPLVNKHTKTSKILFDPDGSRSNIQLYPVLNESGNSYHHKEGVIHRTIKLYDSTSHTTQDPELKAASDSLTRMFSCCTCCLKRPDDENSLQAPLVNSQEIES